MVMIHTLTGKSVKAERIATHNIKRRKVFSDSAKANSYSQYGKGNVIVYAQRIYFEKWNNT